MIPEWTNKYIEIPFLEHGRTPDGVDCWGLVYLIYNLEYNIKLPSYKEGYETTNDLESICGLIDGERGAWYEYPLGSERIGDVILLSIGGVNRHVGIIVGDNYMLHIMHGTEVTLEIYTNLRWANRNAGIYRHELMLDWETTGNPWDDGVAVECGITS